MLEEFLLPRAVQRQAGAADLGHRRGKATEGVAAR